MSGHVVVVRGDLLLLECDAWLAPTDAALVIEEPWGGHVRRPPEVPEGWGDEGVRAVPGLAAAGEGAPRPWLVNTGGRPGVPMSWYREGVRQFIEEAAAALRGASPRHGRARHLLALPVVGTGAGGAAEVSGDVTRELLEELEAGARRTGADVVLVTRTARAFAAAQAMRRRMGLPGEAPLGADLRARARALAERARAGRLVLFLGAGVGSGAGLPGWTELLVRLAGEAGMTAAEQEALTSLGSPLDRARLIEGRLIAAGRRLDEAVGRALGPLERVSLSHALLASLPVREAATTNYDDLFERALRAAGRTLSVLPYEAAESDAWLLKLHGSLRPGGDIVLTRDDYLRYAERRAALAGIVQALLITRHMLFVGFSLEDDNFHRVAHDVRRAMTSAGGAGGAFGTALFLRPEPMLAELWSGQIDFAPVAPPGDSEATRRLELFLDASWPTRATSPATCSTPPTRACSARRSGACGTACATWPAGRARTSATRPRGRAWRRCWRTWEGRPGTVGPPAARDRRA